MNLGMAGGVDTPRRAMSVCKVCVHGGAAV